MTAIQHFRSMSVTPYDEVELLRREVEARFGRRALAGKHERFSEPANPMSSAGRPKGEDKSHTS